MALRKNVSEKDFHTLVSFLTDENPSTLSLTRLHIREILRNTPALAGNISQVSNLHARQEVELINEGLWYERLSPNFQALFQQGPDLDLETGAFLLAQIAYPNFKKEELSHSLDVMAKEVDRMIVKEPALPTRAVRAMQHYLFGLKKFTGNKENYNDPDNSFLNRVLERKVGIPISLSCVYLLVGWRLNLLVHGVGLPGHFIVGHRISKGVIHIDPFNNGRIMRKKDCEVLVRRLGYQFKEAHLDPVTNRQIVERMMVNLINLYTEQGNTARAHWLAQLIQP